MRPTSIALLLPLILLLAGCYVGLPVGHLHVAEGKSAVKDAKIETYPWPDYVTGEDRVKIEDALHTIFEIGGRDARDAEELLVEMDRTADASEFRMVGRIVSEMKTVMEKYKLDNYEGKSRIMVLDRILRKVDGVQERLLGETTTLDIDESEARATRLIRGWNWWYQKGRFLKRYEPWDPRFDEEDN